MKNGDIYKTNKYGNLKVVNYIDCRNVIVEFIDTCHMTTTQSVNIYKGNVRDPMRPSTHGIGYLGVGVYNSRYRAYSIWTLMLYRCYSKKSLERNPTYVDCSVSKDWHNFQNFAKWYEGNYRDGYELDKDLLVVGNRVYSEGTCVLVPPKINCFITNRSTSSAKGTIGVTYRREINKYVARCGDGDGSKKHLGHFDSNHQAHLAWRSHKLQLAGEMKSEMDLIDERIYPNIVTLINS